MRAIRFHQHGGLEVLRVEEAPDPAVPPGSALVRVRACALNHLDLWQRRGMPNIRIPLPHISGSDVSGEVVACADESVAPGTRVMVQPGLSCGRCAECLSGRDNHCARYDVLGYRTDGGYAEMVAVPAANLIPLPDHISFAAAAAFPLTFLTAWHMLVARAHVAAGETVLVLAAGSGVGQAAIQVARLHGARVIATASTADKRTRALSLGAEAVVNHREPGFAEQVRALTSRRGVDVVIEHVGQVTWDQSVRCLRGGGRLVTCGATTGAEARIDLRVLFARQISLLGSYMGSKGELYEAARCFFARQLAPVIDTVLPLDRAVEAQRRMEAGEQFGKLVLMP
jgi:NADPH:quinone reductase-like Zn-dependent oxidoreductase